MKIVREQRFHTEAAIISLDDRRPSTEDFIGFAEFIDVTPSSVGSMTAMTDLFPYDTPGMSNQGYLHLWDDEESRAKRQAEIATDGDPVVYEVEIIMRLSQYDDATSRKILEKARLAYKERETAFLKKTGEK